MKEYKSIKFVCSKDIIDLCGDGKIEGPLATKEICRRGIPFLSSGYDRCRSAAIDFARKNELFYIHARSCESLENGSALCRYDFYKKKQ